MPPRILQGLDRDVYQIIRKLEDQHVEEKPDTPLKFTISGVYDAIKHSNSSLARQKKRPLEDSIDRVLRLRKEERLEDDEEADLEQASAHSPPKPKERDYYLLNKQITKSWNIPRAQPSEMATPEPQASVEAERQPDGEPKTKRRKAERREKEKEDRNPPTDASLRDLGGMDDAIKILVKSITWPMHAPAACEKGLVKPARGVLIHGPPGCGKTMLAKAYAASLGIAFIPVSAPSLVAGMSGESEKKIRELYDEAKSLAPCLVFIDEIDAIMGKRENAQREMEKRIVAQMLTCMDDCDPQKMGGKLVVTLAATNRPDSIDPALRRAGRFNYEIGLGIPNEIAREAILRKMLSKIPVSDDVDCKLLAKRTPGFVGADLEGLISVAQNDLAEELMSDITQETSSATMDVDSESQDPPIIKLHYAILAAPLNAIPENKYTLTMRHLLEAVTNVQPSSKREGFSTIPDTTWAHIGALEDVREELMLSIVEPIHHPEKFKALGIDGPSGVLLWGPPGCGKTLLAKAVANESKANFISVKGPELLNKYVGESERSVRQVFSRARTSAPCIVFFDELDALVPRRDASGTDSSARVVNMLLTELDGINNRSGVYVIGATNRPDMIDPAILRPGRLGTNIFIDLPNADGRVEILKTRIRRVLPSYTEFDVLEAVARDTRCEGFSGADIENLHAAAAKSAMRRLINHTGNEGRTLIPEDWERALNETKPSVSESHSEKFRQLKELGWQ